MKFIRAILIVVCILIMLLAFLCLLSEMWGSAPGVVYAVQSEVKALGSSICPGSC